LSYSQAAPPVSRPAPLGIGALALLATAAALPAQTPECPGYDEELGIVWGEVRAMEGGVPVPGASIVVRWSGGETEAQSLRTGLYIVCGVRPDVPIVIQASLEQFSGRGVAGQLEPGQTVNVPLHVAFGGTAAVAITGRIVGTVVDRHTLQPVSNAVVGIPERGFTGVTDGSGRFVLDDVPPGSRAIQVRHIAYGETEASLIMPSDGTLEVQIRLDPAVIPVEPIEVQVLGVRSHKLEMSGFYERRDWNTRLGLGYYLTRFDIEERAAARVSHILTEIPRVSMIRGDCFSSRCDFPFILGSNASCRSPRREGIEVFLGASLYLDGRRVRQTAGQGIDEFLYPGDLAGIEVYTGSGDLPAEFADHHAQKCGAIVVWTGR
jgi:hypothetical protein